MNPRHLLASCALVAAGAVGTIPGTTATARAQEQRKPPEKADSIPREYRPPAGMCRIWIDGVPAAQQPAPTDCPSAVKNRPANGRVIYGPDLKGGKSPTLPIKGFTKPPKGPPLIPPLPPDPGAVDERGREPWDNKRITDEQLFGDRPATQPALSYPGGSVSPGGYGTSPSGQAYGPMGSYGTGYGAGSGAGYGSGSGSAGAYGSAGSGGFDPRYFTGNRDVLPPGYGSSACLDRDGDGWCDDARFGPPACLDRDRDGRCDDLPGFAAQAYPQTLPLMRSVLDVVAGRVSVEIMQWIGTNEFSVRIPDQGRGGTPWRAIFLDQRGILLQVWTDTDRDGRADRVEVFRNGQRAKLIQR